MKFTEEQQRAIEKLHKERQDYYNSDDLDMDIIGVLLATNRRKPKNDFEKKLLEQIRDIEYSGRSVEFPFN